MTWRTAVGAVALIVAGCGEEPSYTAADLVAHLEAEGIAVEESLDLAGMGAPSAASGGTYLVTLADGTSLLVQVTDGERRARSIVEMESGSAEAAERMGVGGVDTYTTGVAWGNLAVMVEDGTPQERVDEVLEALGR